MRALRTCEAESTTKCAKAGFRVEAAGLNMPSAVTTVESNTKHVLHSIAEGGEMMSTRSKTIPKS